MIAGYQRSRFEAGRPSARVASGSSATTRAGSTAVEASAGRFPGRPPRLRWISTLTGTAFDAGRGPDAAYWRRQLREPVRFDAAVRRLAEGDVRVLLELDAYREAAVQGAAR